MARMIYYKCHRCYYKYGTKRKSAVASQGALGACTASLKSDAEISSYLSH
jgi:hypothetical protein